MTVDDEEQPAANEATFREANERIRQAQRELDPPAERIPYLCECEEPSCHEPVQLSATEYELVRDAPGRGGVVAATTDPRKEDA